MHQRRSADDLASKHLTNGLVAETNPEYRYGFVEISDDVFRDSRIRRRAGSG